MYHPRDAQHIKEFDHVIPYDAPVFEFEEDFNQNSDGFLLWFSANWSWSIWISVIYVTLVFTGKWYMSHREKFDLRKPLAIWSAILAVFSIAGMIRTVPELVYILRHYGLQMAVCNPSYLWGPCSIWTFFFIASKAVELGDTAFIVLRKQPLIFLHWYHHITVMMYCWYTYGDITAPGRWFMAMNYMVHSAMYTYYTLRACRVKVPKFVNMVITSMQLLQMAVGLSAAVFALVVRQRGEVCIMSDNNLRSCILMYASYFILFAQFFKNAYLTPKKPQAIDSKTQSSNGNGVGTKKTA